MLAQRGADLKREAPKAAVTEKKEAKTTARLPPRRSENCPSTRSTRWRRCRRRSPSCRKRSRSSRRPSTIPICTPRTAKHSTQRHRDRHRADRADRRRGPLARARNAARGDRARVRVSPSLRGAKRRSNPDLSCSSGLLRFARNDGNTPRAGWAKARLRRAHRVSSRY